MSQLFLGPEVAQQVQKQQEDIQKVITECAMRAYLSLMESRLSRSQVSTDASAISKESKKAIAEEAIEWSVAFAEVMFNIKAERRAKSQS